MPIHRIPKPYVDADLLDIERQGERPVSITVDGDSLIILTEYVRHYETRGAA